MNDLDVEMYNKNGELTIPDGKVIYAEDRFFVAINPYNIQIVDEEDTFKNNTFNFQRSLSDAYKTLIVNGFNKFKVNSANDFSIDARLNGAGAEFASDLFKLREDVYVDAHDD